MEFDSQGGECPICGLMFAQDKLEVHVNKCLFLKDAGSSESPSVKRKNYSIFSSAPGAGPQQSKKRLKQDVSSTDAAVVLDSDSEGEADVVRAEDAGRAKSKPDEKAAVVKFQPKPEKAKIDTNAPLAERMRPETLEDYIGQKHVMDKNAVLRTVLEKHEIPSMIFWGPPGCGKVGVY